LRLEEQSASSGDRRRRWAALCLLIFAVSIDWAGSAQAAIELESFRFSSTEANGAPSQLAGAHPDEVTTTFVFASHDDGGGPIPFESPRNVTLELPPGLIGNPTALPTCSERDIEDEHGICPPASQIGYVEVIAPSNEENPVLVYPMFNLKPPPDVPAMFGLTVFNARTRVVAELDADRDFGVSVIVQNLPAVLPFTSVKVAIWGVPAASSHDRERGFCMLGNGQLSGASCPVDAPARPLLTNPSACMPVLSVTARVDSWQNTGLFDTATADNEDSTGRGVGITGCESLGFSPTLSVTPSATTPRTPTGLSVGIHAPQAEGPDGRAEATLDEATVVLPRGVAISPSAASGLGACAAGQIQLGNDSPPTCPDNSRLGTATVETPLLEGSLTGPVYLARPRENPFGSRFAVYAVAEGPGLRVKLAGRVSPDPESGELRVTFDHNPQLPFRDLRIDFWAGPRALLSTPPRCGTYTTAAELTAWGATAPVRPSAAFEISAGCFEPRFEPRLTAGSRNPSAGEFSSFTVRLQRDDRDEELGSLSSVDLPPGLSVALRGVAYCPDSALAAVGRGPSVVPTGIAPLGCPGSSRIGSVRVGAGPGPNPFYTEPGDVYLAGPYEGAPLSLAVSVPALVGPFDLGSINLRAGLRVDPEDLHAEIVTGPLPQMLGGVPLQIRDFRLEIDRPRFLRNPTSCRPTRVGVDLVSSDGIAAHPADRFRVAGCRRLGFAPRLALRFTGAPTRRGGHPELRAVLRARPGDAGIARAALTMPPTEFLDNSHIRGVCPRRLFDLDGCPATAVYGYAKVWSPLLRGPLEGPVLLRSSRRKLPDLVASLDGQVKAEVVGRVGAARGRLRVVFDRLPDIPVSRFQLTMQGGRKGLIVNNTELCARTPRAAVSFTAQNGKRRAAKPPVKTGCGKSRTGT
jgi:hypothetical protein